MTNYNQLNKEQRDIIEYMLNRNYSFTQIGKAINMDRTTISKEIRRNRYIKSLHFDSFDSIGIQSACDRCSILSKPLMFVILVIIKLNVINIIFIINLVLLMNIILVF